MLGGITPYTRRGSLSLADKGFTSFTVFNKVSKFKQGN